MGYLLITNKILVEENELDNLKETLEELNNSIVDFKKDIHLTLDDMDERISKIEDVFNCLVKSLKDYN